MSTFIAKVCFEWVNNIFSLNYTKHQEVLIFINLNKLRLVCRYYLLRVFYVRPPIVGRKRDILARTDHIVQCLYWF